MFLLTIIVDDSLRRVIEEEIITLGAKGFTTSAVEGQGRSGLRTDVWGGENVKIETMVDERTLAVIMQRLEDSYFEKYAIIAYSHTVQVLRKSHFS